MGLPYSPVAYQPTNTGLPAADRKGIPRNPATMTWKRPRTQ